MSRATTTLPAAVYLRISADKTGAGHGVERQQADCRTLAKRLNWKVVDVYADNDISAYSGKTRPQYQRLLADVRAGRIRAIVSWHPDRLYRRVIDLEEIVTLTERHDLQIATVETGEIDLSTPSGRLVARQLGSVAQYEIDHGRKRMKAAKAQRARNGQYRGGVRPYGFRKDGTTVVKGEAAVISKATKEILAGRSLRAVAEELNASGKAALRTVKVKDADGNPTGQTVDRRVPWNGQTLREMLLRARNAGLISTGRPGLKGFDIVKDEHGEPVVAKWPAIVPPDKWHALYKLLTDPERRTAPTTSARWIGSGVYTCGKCGGYLRAAPGRNAKHHYRCENHAHLGVDASQTDYFVTDVALELLRDPAVVKLMSDPDPRLDGYRAERTKVTAKIERYNRDYEHGLLEAAHRQQLVNKYQAKLDDLEAKIAAAIAHSTSTAVISAANPATAFRKAAPDVQRAVLRSLLTVTVLPSQRRGPVWDSSRLEITLVAGSTG